MKKVYTFLMAALMTAGCALTSQAEKVTVSFSQYTDDWVEVLKPFEMDLTRTADGSYSFSNFMMSDAPLSFTFPEISIVGNEAPIRLTSQAEDAEWGEGYENLYFLLNEDGSDYIDIGGVDANGETQWFFYPMLFIGPDDDTYSYVYKCDKLEYGYDYYAEFTIMDYQYKYYYLSFYFDEQPIPEAPAPTVTDLTVDVAADGEILAALDAAKAGVEKVGSIIINLAENASYTLAGSIEVPSTLIINGNGATVDATELTTPFVLMSNAPTAEPDENGFYLTGNVEFLNLNVNGLSQQLIYANKEKYLIPAVVTDNCQIQYVGGSKTVYDFNGGGVVGTLDIKNSTINSTPANTGSLYSSQGGQKATDAGLETQTFSIQNSTLYNIANGKNTITHRQNGQKWLTFIVKNNVVLDCGKSGQFVVGLNGGQASANPTFEIDNNSFLTTVDGVVTVTAEKEPTEGAIQNSVGEPTSTFPKAAEGIFTLDEASAQAKAQVGAPKWLVPYFAPATDVTVNVPADGDINQSIYEATAAVAKVGNITLNLAENASYKLSNTIETAAGLVINGNGAKIDASAVANPVILMSETPSVKAVNDYYRVNQIKIDNVELTGVKNSLFYDNNVKYCVVDFSILNSTVALDLAEVQNEAIISFKNGGAKDMTFDNNTIYGTGDVAKYFVRFNNSARLDRYGFDTKTETNNITYISNTFYKVIKSDGQWGNNGGLAQSYVKYDIQKNIWFDCGKDIIRRLAGGQAPKGSDNTFAYNTYFNDGVNIGESEANYDKSETILETNPDFRDAAAADFTIGAATQQAEYQTGAKKWLVEYNPSSVGNIATEQAPVEYYDLNGLRVVNPSNGIYIRKQGANVSKVIVK